MRKLLVPLALTSLALGGTAVADELEFPLEFQGRAAAYTVSGALIAQFSLHLLVEELSDTQTQTTTTVTPLDDPGGAETTVCMATEQTDQVSTVTCDDGARGTLASFGSNSTRRIVAPDGTVRISGSATDDGGERRRNVTTRLDVDGNIEGYIRERLTLISTGASDD